MLKRQIGRLAAVLKVGFVAAELLGRWLWRRRLAISRGAAALTLLAALAASSVLLLPAVTFGWLAILGLTLGPLFRLGTFVVF